MYHLPWVPQSSFGTTPGAVADETFTQQDNSPKTLTNYIMVASQSIEADMEYSWRLRGTLRLQPVLASMRVVSHIKPQ